MVQMIPPKSKFHVRAFIGLVKYYRYMWSRRSHLLLPPTTIISDKKTLKWTDVEQKTFEDIKHIFHQNTL